MTTEKAEREELVESFFKGTAESYDFVARAGTLGFDLYWKRRILSKVPKSAVSILDLGCGTGIVTFALARNHPGASIVGVDMTEDYLEVARQRRNKKGIGNVIFIYGNAENVGFPEDSFDCITSSYIPKYVDPEVLIRNIDPMLKPGGVIIFHDFAYPGNRLIRVLWHCYQRILNFIGKRVLPEWGVVFDNNLTELIIKSNWIRDFQRAFLRHGYTVSIELLTFGCAAIVYVKKKRNNEIR